jgi:hypothetical protein
MNAVRQQCWTKNGRVAAVSLSMSPVDCYGVFDLCLRPGVLLLNLII